MCEASINSIIFFILKNKRMEFNCQRCGNCCIECYEGVEYNPDEVEALIKKRRFNIINQLIDIDGYLEFGHMEGQCDFLNCVDDGYECIIHDDKPEICKQFPFDDLGKIKPGWSHVCPEVKRIIQSISFARAAT